MNWQPSRRVMGFALAALCLPAAARGAEEDLRRYEQTVSRAIDYLSTKGQAEDGSFSSFAGPGVTALVTTALLRHGRSPNDPVVARALKEHGVDIVDVSAGQTSTDAQPVYGRMFQAPFSDQVRNEAHVPTITVGNISDVDQVSSLVAAGRADLCALARPHLADPYFTLHGAAALDWSGQPWPRQYLAARPRPRNGP